MVETHSKRLSPLGPAEQLHGGSRLISASSFWILPEATARYDATTHNTERTNTRCSKSGITGSTFNSRALPPKTVEYSALRTPEQAAEEGAKNASASALRDGQERMLMTRR